jgi:hypothetical protein
MAFQPLSRHVITVIARLAAERVIKEKLRDQGVRVSLVPMRQIREQADLYLSQHPELFDFARERAQRMAEEDELRKARRRKLRAPLITPDLPVSLSDHAKSGTDIAGVFSTTSAIFRGSRLLIAD